jgi:formylglycine-generating enzyme required for sulfatase activity
MTPEAYESDWVLRECQYADRRKKTPLPVLLDGEEFPRYGIIQYADVRGGKLPDAAFYDRLSRSAPRKATRGVETLLTPAVAVALQAAKAPTPVSISVRRAVGAPLRFEPPNLAALLAEPFAWCEVTEGWVTLADASERGGTRGGRYQVETFAISKYPITNAQFQQFVRTPDGYRDSRWWDYSAHAKAWRGRAAQVNRTRFIGSELPRTEVNWYEALAFCRWLSAKSKLAVYPPSAGDSASDSSLLRRFGGQITVTLPTEQQWQRAAQGDSGHAYPWGNTFDASRCNSEESGLGNLTPVTQYPNGASPFGVMDMAGNVWEWCLTEWGSDKINITSDKLRTVRGGSFFVDQTNARLDMRSGGQPDNGVFNRGFRIVCGFALWRV